MAAPADAAATLAAPDLRRFVLPAALLASEYALLSWLVDIPAAGPARALAGAVIVVLPVAVGAVGAGVLLAGGPSRGAPARLPPWRPFPALALQPLAFAALAAWAVRLFAGGAISAGALAAWLAAAAAVALLAVAAAAPLRLVAGLLVARHGHTLLAFGAGLLAWRAAVAAEGLWGVLSGATLRASAALLSAAGLHPEVVPEEALLAVGEFWVEVAPVCSGADGLGLVAVFQGIWLASARERLRFPRALVILPIGAAAALAANVVRLAALVALGGLGHPELAEGGFHSRVGWLLFLTIALGTVAASERTRWLRRDAADERDTPLPPDAAAYLGPLLAAVATALLTGALAAGAVDRLYALRIVAALAALLAARGLLPRPALSADAAALLAGALVAAVWVAVPGGDGAALEAGLRALSPAERAAWIAVRVAGSVIVVPLVEELAFRGFLLPWLATRSGAPARGLPWGALLVSSAAFGAVHASFALGAAAGVVFGLLRLRRGRLGDAFAAHAVANAAIALAVLAFGRWDLWA